MNDVVKIEFTANESYILKEANWYANDVVLMEKTIRESAPYRYALISSYKEFVRLGKLRRINNLSEEEKKHLYEKSLEIQPDKVTKQVRGEICRIVWLLNFVFENYFL